MGSLITRASREGLQMMSDLMHWDPDKRPNSQQTQRYPYFQNLKWNNSGQNRQNPMQQQISNVQTARLSIMDIDNLENNGMLGRFAMNQKYNPNNNDMNDLNSLLSVSRLSHPSEKQFIIENPKNNDSLNNSEKALLKLQNTLNYSILNDMFSNINMKNDTGNSKLVRQESMDVEQPAREESDVEVEEPKAKSEKVNDVYINLAKDAKESSFHSAKSVLDKSLSKNTGFIFNSNGFFLHEPKSKSFINQKSISDNTLNENTNKIYNMFSKQHSNGSFDDGLLDIINMPKSKLLEKNSSLDNEQKWGESFEDDELASILG